MVYLCSKFNPVNPMIPLIQLESIAKNFGDLELYSNINLTISQGDRSAFIAKNGTGKTTLLNIISSNDSPDSGKVTFQNNITIGYLEQEPPLPESQSALECVYHSDNLVSRSIKQYEKALLSNDPKAISAAIEAMDTHGGWDYETRAKTILSQLKITRLDQIVGSMSGGEKKRLALAIILIDNPDVLILDEPTNHLDMEMSQWLEDFLLKSNTTLLMVTHDRYFLDRVCSKIYELDQKQLYTYSGNYTDFMIARSQRVEQFNATKDKAQNLYNRELEWMRRMPQARGTKQKYRKEAFYKTKEAAFATREDSKIKISADSARLGTKIFEAKNICKRFGDKIILKEFSYTFSRGEKLGIVGKNGAGKSTLLNILCGEIPYDSGVFEVGTTVKFGYYRQQNIDFDPNKKVIDVVKDIAEVVTNGSNSMTASQLLTQFLFPAQTQYSEVGRLSGGEKRRLYLLTILIQNPNFLILDEPTNDLDIITLGVLEEYLENFDGCVIVVSHDRFFMDKVVDHLMIFEGDGEVNMFPGNYTQYRNDLEEQKEVLERSLPKNTPSEKQSYRNEENRKVKMSFKEKIEFEALENDIFSLEERKSEIEAKMNSGELSSEQITELAILHKSTSEEIDHKTLRWMELSEKS